MLRVCQDAVSLLNILTRKIALKKEKCWSKVASGGLGLWEVGGGGWISVEREKHTRGRAAGLAPAPGQRETRGKASSGF